MNNDMQMTPATAQSGALVEVEKQRALGEVMAIISASKRFPRDEAMAVSRVSRACQRKGLADTSQYTYSRGGTDINGPSVHLLRSVALAWGNIQSGWQELERRAGESTVRTWAMDMESLTIAERAFIVKHWRDTKQGGYLLKDERDIYELLANQAARRVRSCLQEVIPQDIVDLAVEECDRTLAKGGGVPLADRIRTMVAKFSEMGISKEQIEAKLGHNVEATKESELPRLQKIYVAIKDGVGSVADHFPPVAQVVADAAAATPTKRARRSTMTMVEPEPVPTEVVPGPSDADIEASAGLAPVAEPEPQPAPVAPAPAPAPKRPWSGPSPVAPNPGKRIQDELCEFVTGHCGSSFGAMIKTLTGLGWNTEKSLSDMDSWPGFDAMPDAAANKIWNARRGLELHLKGGAK
jgi:hypothetical protein